MESDLCIFTGIDFRGAIRVNIGLRFQQTKKTREREREREREGEREKGQPRICVGGK